MSTQSVTSYKNFPIISCDHCKTTIQRNHEITCVACESVAYCSEICSTLHQSKHQERCLRIQQAAGQTAQEAARQQKLETVREEVIHSISRTLAALRIIGGMRQSHGQRGDAGDRKYTP